MRDLIVGYALRRRNDSVPDSWGLVVSGHDTLKPATLHVWLRSLAEQDIAAWDEDGDGCLDVGFPDHQLLSPDFAVWWFAAFLKMRHSQRRSQFTHLLVAREKSLLVMYKDELSTVTAWRAAKRQLEAAGATADAMRAIAQSRGGGGSGGGGGGNGNSGGGGNGGGGQGGGPKRRQRGGRGGGPKNSQAGRGDSGAANNPPQQQGGTQPAAAGPTAAGGDSSGAANATTGGGNGAARGNGGSGNRGNGQGRGNGGKDGRARA